MQRTRLYQSIAASALLFSIQGQAASELYFSEYIEGSSYNKALEIVNNTGATVNLEGYAIQVYFNGATLEEGTVRNIDLSGELLDGDVFVYANSRSGKAIADVADLQNGSASFNGDDAITLTHNGEVVDSIGQVGSDPGSQWGTNDTTTKEHTLRRASHVDGGDTDPTDEFDPALEWVGFAQDTFDDLGQHGAGEGEGEGEDEATVCGDEVTKLSAIQGNGYSSPLNSTSVSVEAVLVGNFRGSNALGGFFLQEEDADQDGDPATSEGIFVYEGSEGSEGIEMAMGDVIHLTANVSERYGQTQLSGVSNLQVCSSGETVTAATVELPLAEITDLESVEGMSVSFWQELSVTETYALGRYGELSLSVDGRLMNPTQVAMPGEEAIALGEANDRRRILLDDGRGQQNQDAVYPAPGLSADNVVRVGDSVLGLNGVMAYGFGSYRIHPTADPVFVPANMRTAEPDLPGEGSLKVASFNVLNYFNG
ncbi:MAG TPA: hypothetical protein ENI05_15970, partial [Porticoccus sp.]|nr:hypothetical protein [Porticoccus sp.]